MQVRITRFKMRPESVGDAGGSGAGTGWAGIWKRDGSMLTIVDNAPDPRRPRPSAFSAPVGSGYAMIVLTPWE